MKEHRLVIAQLRKAGGLFNTNPVLILGMALPFAIVPTTSLRMGVVLSIAMLAATLPSVIISRVLAIKFGRWFCIAVGPVCASVCLMLCQRPLAALFSTAMYNLSIYYHLLAVNSILLTTVAKVTARKPFRVVITSTMLNIAGFAIVVCALGFLRELFGNASIWSRKISMGYSAPALLITFCGFITLGFLAAIFRQLRTTVIALWAKTMRYAGGSVTSILDSYDK